MLITCDDIQRIGDEDTLMHFLEEKLNLPIPENVSLKDITSKFSNFVLGLSGSIAEQVLDCQELSVSPGESSGIVLIRFTNELDYVGALRAVAKGMDRRGLNLADLRFICTDECYQPFAFAYFNDPVTEDWDTEVLTIFTWTQENTYIHTSLEHELPVDFFIKGSVVEFDSIHNEKTEYEKEDDLVEENIIHDESKNEIEAPLSQSQGNAFEDHIVELISPDALLAKLENIGIPLEHDWNIYTGSIVTGSPGPFVIDDTKYQHLIKVDPKNSEIVKRVLLRRQQKWKTEPAHLIEILSSHKKQWPWSSANDETEAEQIFSETYPEISTHLNPYKDSLKIKVDKGKFWWELKSSNFYSLLQKPKIVYPTYPGSGHFMRASYDEIGVSTQDYLHSILTSDLSLLAILNSRLFDWYALERFNHSEKKLNLNLSKKNMKNVPIAARTSEQKSELSNLVQQILDAPDSPNVPSLEEEINMLVYDLYELTAAEIALIEEESN